MYSPTIWLWTPYDWWPGVFSWFLAMTVVAIALTALFILCMSSIINGHSHVVHATEVPQCHCRMGQGRRTYVVTTV